MIKPLTKIVTLYLKLRIIMNKYMKYKHVNNDRYHILLENQLPILIISQFKLIYYGLYQECLTFWASWAILLFIIIYILFIIIP